jgi:hypothetical protein
LLLHRLREMWGWLLVWGLIWLLLWLLLRICYALSRHIEARALALTHRRGRGGRFVLYVSRKGRLLTVMSRGLGIRIRW